MTSRRIIRRSSITSRASAGVVSRVTRPTSHASSHGATRRATSSSGTPTASAARSASTSRAKRCSFTRRVRTSERFAPRSKSDTPTAPTSAHRHRRRPRRRRRKAEARATLDERSIAFARLFQNVREGVYVGTLGANSTTTLAANPHLKTIFGYPPDAAETIVQPFDPSRFVDPLARQTFIELLDRDEGCADHLIRVRRVDGAPIWIEVSASA